MILVFWQECKNDLKMALQSTFWRLQQSLQNRVPRVQVLLPLPRKPILQKRLVFIFYMRVKELTQKDCAWAKRGSAIGVRPLKKQSCVVLRPPPVTDKGSKVLSEIRSIRKWIYIQRNATIFQTGKHLRERWWYFDCEQAAIGEADIFK